MVEQRLMHARQMRRIFFIALWRQLRVVWPILSGIIVLMLASGLVIGWQEDWGLGESLYFTFVTGLTIGYGDFVPHTFTTRLLAMVIGVAGIVLAGLIVAVSVQALRAADDTRPGNAAGDE
jgi:peptidoglycan/LPS O-acetylase OafA/YrhL